MLGFGLSTLAIKLGAFAVGAGVLAGAGWFAYSAVYSRGFDAAAAQHVNISLQAALAEREKQLRDAQEVIAEDRALAEQQAAEIAALKEKANATPANDAPCLDAGAAGRIDSVR